MKSILVVSVLVMSLVIAGCKSSQPQTTEEKAVMTAQTKDTTAVFKQKDSSINRFFTESYGYAIFPQVFKAAFVGGGASGDGQVYEQGKLVGYSKLSQATIGFSFGGEYFREIIFFKDKADLDSFKVGQFTFAAQATGVALSEGVAAKANYENGTAVFVMADKGLMADASLGGQKFTYTPATNTPPANAPATK
jgi:lipid-binding SYLF domain-containing protein